MSDQKSAPASDPAQDGQGQGHGPIILEPASANMSPDTSSERQAQLGHGHGYGHRDQDLAWSRSSTPNSSQPKSILQHATAGGSKGEASGSIPGGGAGVAAAASTLEPEAATQAAQGSGDAETAEGRRGSEGKRSVKVLAAGEQPTGTATNKAPSEEEQGSGKRSAGLTLPRRAAPALASAEIQSKFIALYTNDDESRPREREEADEAEYHSTDNPDGLISLGVAENHLMDDVVLPKFREAASSTFAETDLGYGDGMASRRLKSALGRYFDDWQETAPDYLGSIGDADCISYFAPRVPLEPDHIIVGNGCSALFDQMAHVMCEPGDAILIPQPYYVAYTADFTLRTEARVEPVFVGHMDEGFELDMVKGLEKKVDELAQEGVRSRVLVFTNPNNPLGRTYPRETILAVAKFAQERDMYLVINEIYAQSVYDNEDWPDAPDFVSSLSIDFEKEVPGFEMARLSVVYGMSKDFCANGLRVGVLVIQHNPELYMALLGIGFFSKISSMSDAVWSNVLNDRQWLETFLAENRRRLGQAARETREWFKVRGVEVSRSNGGNFMLVNLGKRLDKSTEEGELEISKRLSGAGVFLATGKNFKQTTPGWFRVTFCAEPKKLAVALERNVGPDGLTLKEAVLITGGSSGIGLQCALEVAKLRPEVLVIVASRSAPPITLPPNVTYPPLHLSSRDSIRAFVANWTYPPLSALICNAAIHTGGPPTYDPEGIELDFAVAVLGRAVLLCLLYIGPSRAHEPSPSLLSKECRIIQVSSVAHDPKEPCNPITPLYVDATSTARATTKGLEDPNVRYPTTKVAVVLFSNALARRAQQAGKGWVCAAFDPGFVPQTGLQRYQPLIVNLLVKYLAPRLTWLLRWIGMAVSTPSASGRALAALALGVADMGKAANGSYWQIWESKRSADVTYDERLQEDLWDWIREELKGDVKDTGDL